MKKMMFFAKVFLFLACLILVLSFTVGLVGTAVTGILYEQPFDVFTIFMFVPICLLPFYGFLAYCFGLLYDKYKEKK